LKLEIDADAVVKNRISKKASKGTQQSGTPTFSISSSLTSTLKKRMVYGNCSWPRRKRSVRRGGMSMRIDL